MDNDWTNTDIQATETTSGHSEVVEETVKQAKVKWEFKQETRQRVIKLTQRKQFAMRKR